MKPQMMAGLNYSNNYNNFNSYAKGDLVIVNDGQE